MVSLEAGWGNCLPYTYILSHQSLSCEPGKKYRDKIKYFSVKKVYMTLTEMRLKICSLKSLSAKKVSDPCVTL